MQERGGAVLAELVDDEVADEVGEPGHAAGELLGMVDAGRLGGGKVAQQGEGGGMVGGVDGELARRQDAGEAGDEAGFFLALHEPAELQIIGEEEIGQRAAVAGELLGIGRVIEGDADVLGLDVAEGEVAGLAGDEVVGRAGGGTLGLVDGGDGGVERFEQGLEERPVGVLGGVAAFQGRLDLLEINLESGFGGDGHNGLSVFVRRASGRCNVGFRNCDSGKRTRIVY